MAGIAILKLAPGNISPYCTTDSSGGNKQVGGFSHTCVEKTKHLQTCNSVVFSHMCAFSHTYVSKSKHVWKIAPRCKYTNVFGFFQTCWIKVKHLPKLTCVVFYTQVWLFSNIFAKSQTCVEKTIMFH